MLRTLLAGAATSAMILVSTGAVKAADMIEPEAAMFDWSGFYLGVHGGYGWANFEGCHECDESSSVLDADDLDVHGPLIGVHGGFNVQSGAMVFGIEGDVSFTNWEDTEFDPSDSDSQTGSVDMLASVRGRLGWADDNALFYLTGGVAFADAEWEADQHGNHDSVDFDDIGGVVGGGVEWAISDHISLRGEGLFYFFGDEQDIDDIHSGQDGESIELDNAFVARVGATFNFGGFGG